MGPGDNGNEEDPNDESTTDAIHHHENREEATSKDAQPESNPME